MAKMAATLEEFVIAIKPSTDLECVETIADNVCKIEDDFADVKGAVQRLLGKKLRRVAPGEE